MTEHLSHHEPQDPQGEIDPKLFAMADSNGYYATYLAVNYLVKLHKRRSAERRKAKGLPEKRRSPLAWARDEVVVWKAKRNLEP